MRKETTEEKRARLLNKARQSVGSAYAGEEHSIIQAINSYLEVEKVRNLLFERIDEWYGMYFPELRISNPSSLVNFIIKFGGNKKEVTQEELKKIVGEKAGEVFNQIRGSIGREPSAEEFAALKHLAEGELQIIELEEKLDEYLSRSVKDLMPNISYLIEYKIAAELLSKAGSLERMAMMPAGTIQLLGAEKALFKHLKYGSKPPKYGVLFKMQQVAIANKKYRGRVARVYATKIAIASKADAFSKNFIADKLKISIDNAIKRMNEKKPKSSHIK